MACLAISMPFGWDDRPSSITKYNKVRLACTRRCHFILRISAEAPKRATCAHLRLVRAQTHEFGPGKLPVSYDGAHQAQMHQ
eukprot:2376658-Pleurochrysis_carterae.AAC.1